MHIYSRLAQTETSPEAVLTVAGVRS